MPIFLQSLIVLAFMLIVARYIKRGSPLLQKFFIPSALLTGVAGLILGPQVLGYIPAEITGEWKHLPEYLISIVFAGLFLGKVIPKRKDVWKQAGPQIAFGNTLAWGQYMLGAALTLFILVPFFDASPLAAGLIEISFEGGHGTTAGLEPTFSQLGWPEGTDVGLALATVSIVTAIFAGLLFVNFHHRRVGHHIADEEWEQHRRQLIRSGYNLIRLTEKFNANPRAIIINCLAFAAAIGLGWLLRYGLIEAENIIAAPFTDIRFLTYVPLFTFAMIGGIILQLFLRKIGKQTLIQRRTATIISSIALDVLIVSAVATLSLSAVSNNLPIFIILGIAGIVWILGGFMLLAPRMFPTFWFEKGLTNMGQSMGMTATGLLLQRLADPTNHTKSKESFAYKQLVFEPFMGGGIVTAASLVFIFEFGLKTTLVVSTIITLFWLILGLRLKRSHHKHEVPGDT